MAVRIAATATRAAVVRAPLHQQVIALHVDVELLHLVLHAQPGAQQEHREDPHQEAEDHLPGQLHGYDPGAAVSPPGWSSTSCCAASCWVSSRKRACRQRE